MVRQIHLLVLIHGMWGNPGHLTALDCAIEDKHAESNKDGEELDVLLTQSNRNKATYDGIDWGGERIADEVRPCRNAIPLSTCADVDLSLC